MYKYIRLIRAPHWIKNFFIFVPLLYSKNLFHWDLLTSTLMGFAAFCMLSSLVYIINDIVDREADRTHPKKRNRPIASGAVSVPRAVAAAVVLAVLAGVLLALLNLNFVIAALAYLALNLLYSFYLKHVVILDIFSIAAGFMLRVASGALIIGVAISSWLLLTTMFISLFLAVMKRFSEIQLQSEEQITGTRRVLDDYSVRFIEQMATIAAGGVILCYALYVVSDHTVEAFGTENLIFTIPFVVFGIFRYMHLVYNSKKGESPVEAMLTDFSMIANVIAYIVTTVLIVYKVIPEIN